MAIRARMTKEGFLIPREVAERVFGEGSVELEISEEPGRLVVSTARKAGERASSTIPPEEDPIPGLSKDPVRTGARDGSTEHDRYLYTGE